LGGRGLMRIAEFRVASIAAGRAVGDLRTAINRIGHNMVRSAAISFAMAQIRNAKQVEGTGALSQGHLGMPAQLVARVCPGVGPAPTRR